MSRKGLNPNRHAPLKATPFVVATVITHLPNLEGYHAGRLDVVKVSLRSLKATAPDTFIVIWDNGSCAELLEWLRDEYKPDILIEAPNMGKPSAQKALVNMFPPMTVMTFADDDMLYYPGWLEESLRILDAYPECVVSGYPTRSQARGFHESAHRWAADAGAVKRVSTDVLPMKYLDEYCESVEMPSGPPDNLKAQELTLLEHNGVEAIIGGHHCQFMGFAQTLEPFFDFANKATRNEGADFDTPLDRAGILKLGTADRYTRHIGNILDGTALEDAQAFGYVGEWNYA